MDKLTRDLVTEYKDTGIIVQSLMPGYVATNMSRIRISSYTAPSPTEYTQVALKTIGLQTRSAGYPPHRVMVRVTEKITIYAFPIHKKLVLCICVGWITIYYSS